MVPEQDTTALLPQVFEVDGAHILRSCPHVRCASHDPAELCCQVHGGGRQVAVGNGEHGGIMGMGMHHGEYILAILVDVGVHGRLPGWFSLPPDHFLVHIHNHNVILCDNVIGHTGGSDRNIACFWIPHTYIPIASHYKTGFHHP